MYRALRPLLFQLDAERAHGLTLSLLGAAHRLGVLRVALPRPPRRPIELMGLVFPNRVGLAAGFDKNAACIDALGALGFGFIEVGTVTPRPQAGNAKPRVFRVREAEAVINRMGFPNGGVAALTARLRLRRFSGICGVNIGKNAATPLAAAGEDYAACLEAVYPYSDYVALNISSPNTPGLRELERAARLRPLLERLLEQRARLAAEHGRRVPLLVKLSPDLGGADLSATAALLGALRIDGVIATNTTLERPGIAQLPVAREAGGLSGAPLLERSVTLVRKLREHLGAAIPIIGVGGINSAAAARKMLAAGADLVQLYTGLLYRGPRVVREIAQL